MLQIVLNALNGAPNNWRMIMKKFAIAIAALATVFSTSAMAAPGNTGHDNRGSSQRTEQRADQRHDDRGRGEVRQTRNQQSANRSWKRGDRFDSRQARNYRQISTPRSYGLSQAPSGHRWVQSGNDAVLIGITSGIVSAIMANVIR